MADQGDVETALASVVANALYPNGTGAASAIGKTCRVYRGYPNAPSLDADLAADVLHVSVVPGDAPGKNMTRYPRKWIAVSPVAEVLSATVSGLSATFNGDCAAGQLAGVMVNGTLFPYAVQASDSAATVASNLGAILRESGWLVNYAGRTITVPAAERFEARVVSGAGSLLEIKRQVQEFKVSMWCPDPASRDAVAAVIDPALASCNFLPLADGSSARLMYSGSTSADNLADATLYRRDLIYSAEYPTTLSQMTPAMLFGRARFTADSVFVENLQN